jgi:hypothetical protein
MDLTAHRRRTMSRYQRRIVSGVTSSRSSWRRFRYHDEGGRDPGPVRPVHAQAARLLPLQDSELVAQDQDLDALPRLLAPGQPQPGGRPHDQEEDEPHAHDR